jgi:hypothetical protein
MDNADDYYDVDEVLPILSPEEAFAPVPGKPHHQVCDLRVGASERFEERVVDGELVLIDLPGVDVRYYVEAVYQDGWWDLLYWGTDSDAAWALAQRVSGSYQVPVLRARAP